MNTRIPMTLTDFKPLNERYAGMPLGNPAILSTSLTVAGKTVPNRLACQAMEGCDGEADGAPGELTRRRYRRFAEGGAGLIWFEATACHRDGRANPRQLWLHDGTLDAFRRIADDIREWAFRATGAVPLLILQDTHSGGSGCGCSALALCGYLLEHLNTGKLKKILFCGTGALLSPTSTQQGLPIPGVCHAVSIISGRD